MESFLMKNDINKDYDVDQMFKDLDKVNFKKVENLFIILKGGNYDFENIPKIFYDSKVIKIIKNKDDKCIIYDYVRKYLNDVKNTEKLFQKKIK